MDKRIITERLVLRPLRETDAPDVFEWAGDPVVNRFMPYPLHQSPENAIQWIRSIKPEENEFGFECRQTGKLIGAGNIRRESDGKYAVGYNLNRNYWGMGYATETASGMIRWAFQTLGAREFTARHAAANVASANVLRKCGFVYDHDCQYTAGDGVTIIPAKKVKLLLDETGNPSKE